MTAALAAGYRTPDLVAATGEQPGQRKVGTQAMADAVVAALQSTEPPGLGGDGRRSADERPT